MALQAGMGVSRLLILVGAGYTGTVLMRNGKMSDVIAELQKLIQNYEGGEGEGESDLSVQVRRLTEQMRLMAQNSRTVIVNGNSEQFGLSSLVVPAATLGALGYGYMWWKGISFSDLMYVTKRGMATAVENLTKHLDHVSDVLAATKKHLTQRIENLDGKLDEQMEMSKLLRADVTDVRGDLSDINCNLDELRMMVTGLDGKLLTLEAKQELANAGVLYLCSFVDGKREKMPEKFQEQLKGFGRSVPNIMGLKELALESGNGNHRSITDKSEKVWDVNPRSVTRKSIAC